MTCESTMSPPPEKPRTAAEERAERLAAQLRANLRRRKDQARGRSSALDEAARAGEPESDAAPAPERTVDASTP